MLSFDLRVRQDAEKRGQTALRIAVNDKNLVAADAQPLRQRHSGRRLGDTAFEIGYSDRDGLSACGPHAAGAQLA